MTRQIKAMQTPGVEPGMAATATPEFRWVEPSELLVDEAYQRTLSERSVTLIRKIVGEWDWARFKPPVVAQTDAGLEVIDGQHTAIAAVSHPDITTIPVMVIRAAEVADRAKAFVGHNRDRITLTPVQIHFANVSAGDEDAVTIQQVCERAGIRLLRYPPGGGAFQPGDTLAVSSIRGLINRRGAMGARRVLEILGQAKCAPVSAGGIKAVEVLLFDPEFKGQVDGPYITSVLLLMGPAVEQEAKVFAAAHNVPIWRGLAVVLFKGARRGRRRTG